jgi:sugar/nucleoside kinase (ribokinase family)
MSDILCVGHVCHDLLAGHYVLGGTASYASILTSRLGMETAVLTSFGPEFQYLHLLEQEGISVSNKASTATTVFENRYLGEHRRQLMLQRAATLGISDLPKAWAAIPIVILGPIADEIDASLIAAFPNSLVGATIQGWLRQVNTKKEVEAKPMEWALLRKVDIAFVSAEDLGNLAGALEQIIAEVKIVVLTNGPAGAKVFQNGVVQHFPVFPVQATDPTGAGDIFAAAFLVHFAKSKDLSLAMAYAHAAASLIVENKGLRLPDIAALEQRYKIYVDQFIKKG